jgi:uncharacterized Zn-binding protein involved in type VI secretion
LLKGCSDGIPKEALMLKLAIVVRDIMDHGGTVLTGSKADILDDFPMAHVGSDVICPLHGHTTIISGQLDFLIGDGTLPLALEEVSLAVGLA